MTTSFGNSCSFGLLYMSVLSVYQFMRVYYFAFGFDYGMRDFNAVVPDHCLSFNFLFLYICLGS